MRAPSIAVAALGAAALSACSPADPGPATGPAQPPPATILPAEVRFGDLRQLTYGGENAEAYWSYDDAELILQSRPAGQGCDKIFRLPLADPAKVARVSTGKGATTCSYFLPGNDEIIYASTHLGGDACPPRPDHSQGYVWALYDSYDIFKAKADGSELTRLTDTPGYDAAGTVCPLDGRMLFT